MPKLSTDEQRTFLDEPGHLVRIGTTDADGMPRIAPTWFEREGDHILFTPRKESVFLENLRNDPRVALLFDETALPYRKVNIRGVAEIRYELEHDEIWRETYRSIACRYIPRESADRYLDDTIDQTRALVAVSLVDAEVTSWRMPIEGESGTGIWARRYYAQDTKMARRAEAAADGS
ncbi:MAG: nitroimidazol reductase NimA-like FMN-containing flavoprotein [Candidatus Poriferisodalaceae bacterium]|jgi:nitroimidazol reductase NimA-like FMN-containing flavoprotein (pyridoxamine 5'-phosphate oxidase superfamily)